MDRGPGEREHAEALELEDDMAIDLSHFLLARGHDEVGAWLGERSTQDVGNTSGPRMRGLL